MGGVIMCAVLHGEGGGKGNSKWQPVILHEIKYLVFHNYFVFFGKKKILPKFMFSDPISFRY